MKNRKRIIAVLLVLVLCASLFTGCETSTMTNITSQEVKEQKKKNVKAVIPATEYDFILDGDSTYYILLPEEATENEQFAASELQTFVKEATGTELVIQKEKTTDTEGSFLSVGNTKASQNVGIEPTYDELKTNGFMLKTVGDDCYIKGYSDMGTRNGIYEFLYYCFDYECYDKDEIVLTETKNLKMPLFELSVVPSFEFREGPMHYYDEAFGYRMRFNHKNEIFVTDAQCHNSFDIINPTLYAGEEYKDWFSPDGRQLCYSNTEMWEEYLKNLKEVLKDNNDPVMILGIQDGASWCECKKCVASKEQYGADSATIIKFCNYMQTNINEWYATEFPGKDPVMLVIFAYLRAEEAPVKYDENTDTYVLADESLKLHEDSGVMFAPIHANYAYSFNSKYNEITKANVEKWNVISENMLFWTYTVWPLFSLVMHDTLEVMQENYQTLLENDACFILDQMPGWQKNGNSGWNHAIQYVMSKLQWNVNLNMEEVLDDFFDNYFDVAGDTMRNVFEEERQWWRHIWADLGSTGTIYEDPTIAQFWTYPMLRDSLEQMEQAYEEIAVYKESNPERYKLLYDRITLESLQYRYLILQLYTTEYAASEVMDMKYAFRRDMERLQVITHAENINIDTLWKEWGISDSM